MSAHVDIVFDGPPGPQAGRFVEVENAEGSSIKFGEWIQRKDGYWVLRITTPFAIGVPVTIPDAVCKGDWVLGSACGRCSRCIETASLVVAGLRAGGAAIKRRLEAVKGSLLVGWPSDNLSPEFKAACFEEARRILKEEAGG